MVTVPLNAAVVPVPTKKMRVLLFPLIVRLAIPGPLISTLLLMRMRLARVIVPLTAKPMFDCVAQPDASATAWRSDPGPESLVFVTVMLQGSALIEIGLRSAAV